MSRRRNSEETNGYEAAMEVAAEKIGDRRQVRLLQRNGAVRRLLTAELRNSYDASLLDPGGVSTAAEGDTPFLDFLKWLIENPEKFGKFIEIILGLFAGIASVEAE